MHEEMMPELINACLVVDGISFEVINDTVTNKLLATDLTNLSNKASLIVREGELVLSVSSFRNEERERALLEAAKINRAYLLDVEK